MQGFVTGLLLGLILGAISGIVIMSLCAISSRNGEIEDVMSDMRRENEND